MTGHRQKIAALVAYWRPIMALDTWMIAVKYDETVDLANCECDAAYETATIRFNLKRARKEVLTPEALEELTVHELTHCLAPRENERNVTRLARALLRAHGRTLS